MGHSGRVNLLKVLSLVLYKGFSKSNIAGLKCPKMPHFPGMGDFPEFPVFSGGGNLRINNMG